jgi:hypothetical protein
MEIRRLLVSSSSTRRRLQSRAPEFVQALARNGEWEVSPSRPRAWPPSEARQHHLPGAGWPLASAGAVAALTLLLGSPVAGQSGPPQDAPPPIASPAPAPAASPPAVDAISLPRQVGAEQAETRGHGAVAYHSTVSARRFPPEEALAFPQEVLAGEARRLPLVDGDVYRSLHFTPGVQANDFSARFALRGGETDDLLTLVDGVPLLDPFHLQDYGGALSAIDLGVVERIALLGDGFGARFGERLGGVIQVETRRPRGGHELAAGVDLLQSRLRALGPLGEEGSYLLSLRRGYIDLFLKAWAPNVGFMPAYWDLLFRVDRRVTGRDTLSWYGFWAADTNQMLREDPRPDLASRYGNGMTWVRWQRELGSGSRMDTVLALGHATRDRQEGSLGHDQRALDQLMAQQEWACALPSRLGSLSLGGRLRLQRGSYDYRVRDLVDLNDPGRTELAVQAAVEGVQAGLWLQHEASWLPWLQIQAGLRLDWVQGVNAINPGPRLALALQPLRTLTLRAAWGRYSQPVTPLTLPVEGGLDHLATAERAEHRTVGLLWRPGPWLNLRAEGYWRSYDDLAGWLPDLGREERVFIVPSAGRALGLELEVRGMLLGGRLGWLLGYAISRAEEWAGDGARYPRPGDRTHALVGGLDLGLGAVGHLSVAYRFQSGVPYTPAVGVLPATDGSAARIRYGAPNSARLPPFHSLDARLSRTWRWEHFALSAYLQVLNATLRTNVHEYVHEVHLLDGTALVARREEHYLPVLPMLGLEGQWLP